jgi:hypothetical protein
MNLSGKRIARDLVHAGAFAYKTLSAYSESLLERTGRIYTRHSTAVALVGVYLFMQPIFILWAGR